VRRKGGRAPSFAPTKLRQCSLVLVRAERGHSRHCRAKLSSMAGRYRQAQLSGALPCRARVSWHSIALDTAIFPGRIATVTAAGELRLRAPHMLMAEPLGSIPGLTGATPRRGGPPPCSPTTTPSPFAAGEPPSSARPSPSCLLAWIAGHSPPPVTIRPPTDASWHGGAHAALPRRRHRPHQPDDGQSASHRPPPLFPVPGG
jgi:hypothetical protein